jgi:hypothetical protein
MYGPKRQIVKQCMMCSDKTGTIVLERHELTKKDKGYRKFKKYISKEFHPVVYTYFHCDDKNSGHAVKTCDGGVTQPLFGDATSHASFAEMIRSIL